MKAVLFDVDGTLIKAGGAGREALARGAAAALGRPLDEARAAAQQIDFRGRTDELLVEDLCGRLGVSSGPPDGKLLDAYLIELPATLAAAETEVLPGVRPLLEHLESRSDVVVGLITGNIRAAARIKLDHFGLGRLVDGPGGFGDDGRERGEIARVAFRRLLARGVTPERAIVVGDTEHDVAAARVVGARAVAVATGWTPLPTLTAAEPDLCLRDFSDPALFLEFLSRLDD